MCHHPPHPCSEPCCTSGAVELYTHTQNTHMQEPYTTSTHIRPASPPPLTFISCSDVSMPLLTRSASFTRSSSARSRPSRDDSSCMACVMWCGVVCVCVFVCQEEADGQAGEWAADRRRRGGSTHGRVKTDTLQRAAANEPKAMLPTPQATDRGQQHKP